MYNSLVAGVVVVAAASSVVDARTEGGMNAA